jgi:hypothetical protein
MMRVAVCISGQLRTWRTCVEATRQRFERPGVHVDYFLHSWDENHWRKPFTVEKVPSEEFAEAVEAFGAKKARQDVTRERPGPWSNLFTSFSESITLKREQEIAQGWEYDCVVKYRFDVIFSPDVDNILSSPPEPLVVYSADPCAKFREEYYRTDFRDVVFYGDSPTMDIVSQITQYYFRTPETDSNSNTGNFAGPIYELHGPGVELWRHMTKYNIEPRSLPYYNVIVRKPMAGFDPIKDFDKISEFSNGWHHQQ